MQASLLHSIQQGNTSRSCHRALLFPSPLFNPQSLWFCSFCLEYRELQFFGSFLRISLLHVIISASGAYTSYSSLNYQDTFAGFNKK